MAWMHMFLFQVDCAGKPRVQGLHLGRHVTRSIQNDGRLQHHFSNHTCKGRSFDDWLYVHGRAHRRPYCPA